MYFVRFGNQAASQSTAFFVRFREFRFHDNAGKERYGFQTGFKLSRLESIAVFCSLIT